jgi:hypothetical protein
MTDLTDEEKSSCQKPCDPDVGCPECAGYWERMISEGFWDQKNHRWTDRGWKEMMK